MSRELYISVDVEADGPIPAQNSMLSFGAVAYWPSGRVLGTFTRNLQPLPGAVQDADTMAWWANQGDAYAKATANPADPAVAMPEFAQWLDDLAISHGAKPVMVGYPILYDGMWLHWYLMRFVKRSPFSHSGIDIKTLGMLALNTSYRSVGKRNLKKLFPSNLPHTHVALDDATEQGELFLKMHASLQSFNCDKCRVSCRCG